MVDCIFMSLSRLPQISNLVLDAGMVRGWAHAPGLPASAVQLLLDGKVVSTESNGQLLPAGIETQCGKPPVKSAGFCFPLPAGAQDGFEHTLQVLLRLGDDNNLYSPLLTLQAAAVRGEVQQQGRDLVVSVWANELKTSRIVVCIGDANGKLLHRQRLQPNQPRQEQGFPASFRIPASQLGSGPYSVTCNGVPLRGSPFYPFTVIAGVVEHMMPSRISGWALNLVDLLQPVQLVLRVDGAVIDWFHCNIRRPDVPVQLSLDEEQIALPGFATTPPALLMDGKRHLVEVIDGNTGRLLQEGQRFVQWQPNGVPYRQIDRPKPPASAARKKFPPPQVSVVILNLNGAGLLETLLSSWQAHNCTVPAELIVIDHNSTDTSLAVLRKWQRSLDLQVIALPRNDSFAVSSNRGAGIAKAPYLLFLNNDIELVQDVLPRLLETLNDPSVGFVGLKLVKEFASPGNNRIKTQVTQHLGVRFLLKATVSATYLPYEAMPLLTGVEAEHMPMEVPAITGALMLCRKQDFEAVGGFDPGYFYGFEDIEICLRFNRQLQKKTICRNDCMALHHHGFTRLSGRQRKIMDRVSRNTAVLIRQCGFQVKQQWWSSLVAGDGFYTRERLCIGLVGTAIQLAAAVAHKFPKADIRLIEPDQRWKQVDELHVLVVGDPRYDITTLNSARLDLLTVAFVEENPERWTQLAWWQEFEAVLVPGGRSRALIPRLNTNVHKSTPAMPLGQLIDANRHRMRVHIIDSGVDTEATKRGQRLLRQLRINGVACWLVNTDALPRRMVDICVRLNNSGATLITSRVEDAVIQVDWPKGTPAPTANWLRDELERHFGSTLRSS